LAGVQEPAVVAPPPASRRRRIASWGGDLLKTAGLALILALLLTAVFRGAFQNFRVEGSSMDPSLSPGEYVLVNKAVYLQVNLEAVRRFLPFVDPGARPLRYLFRAPRRGDVVVFRFPDDPSRNFIKRIIGVPGDRVEIHEGTVYVNGEALPDSFTENPARYAYGPAVVPEGQYFVLGDNRNNSYDSHVWGMVPAKNIIGVAWLTYWPLSKLGFVNNLDLGP